MPPLFKVYDLKVRRKGDKEKERSDNAGYFHLSKDMYALTRSRGVQARRISTYEAIVLFYIVLLLNRA
jgi:hypothetical protein